MTLAALFLCAALLYAAWLRLGWQRLTPAEVPALWRTSGGLSVPCVLLALYTLQEYPSWGHLTFPPSLIVWAALLLLALAGGSTQLARQRRGSGWALLGLPVTGLLTAFTAFLFR